MPLDSATCKSCSTIVHICWKKSLCMLDSYSSNSYFSRVKLSFLTFKCSYKFFVDIVYQLEKYPTLPGLMTVFVKNKCWILLDAFSASVDMIIQFFLFIRLMWWIILTDFEMFNQPYIPGINSPLYNSFIYIIVFYLPTFCWEFLLLCS